MSQSSANLGRVLITGGCGFIGSNLARRLIKVGACDHIRVIDNESLGNRKVLESLDVEFVHGDIRDDSAVRDALAGVNAVVHLAADTRVLDSIDNPVFNYENNVMATFGLLNAMRDLGVERLANASTGGAILGEVPPPVHEEMVPEPLSPYGASKLAVEGYCSAFSASYGLKALSMRFSNVYGPLSFHKGSVVAAFFRTIMEEKPVTIYGDGSQIRDYVYIDDLCDGIIAGLNKGEQGVFQLGTGIPTTLNQLTDEMAKVTGAKYPVEVLYEDFRTGEIKDTYCNISKARDKLGYNPATSLDRGLEETWQWFLDRS